MRKDPQNPDVKVMYVSDSLLANKFGDSFPKTNTVQIREDLPPSVKEYVEDHERYHLVDPGTWPLMREIRANLYAARRHPKGFLHTGMLTLRRSRLEYYKKRFEEGK